MIQRSIFRLLNGLSLAVILSTHSAAETNANQCHVIKDITLGHSLVFEHNSELSQKVHLVGIMIDKPRSNAREPKGQDPTEILKALLIDHEACWDSEKPVLDRHNRILAHVYRKDGPVWVQRVLLERGLARVHTHKTTRDRAYQMLAAEAAARSANLGLWADPYYQVRDPNDLARLIGNFQLVEGRVLDVVKRASWTYLNFDKDWRTDFTVVISNKDLPFIAQDIQLDTLANKRIRVRGWVKEYYGPMIEVTHPEQIELLE